MMRTVLPFALVAALAGALVGTAAAANGHWPLNEGAGQVVTNTLGGPPAALGNSPGPDDQDPTWIDGRLRFDGTNDCVQVGGGADFTLREQGTLAAWIKPDPNWNGEGAILIKPSNWYFVLGQQQQPAFIYYFVDVFSGMRLHTYLYAERAVPAGVWSHVAVSIGDRAARFYVNGTPAGVQLFEDEVLVTTPRPVRIGCEGETARAFAGCLAGVSVSETKLNRAAILAHMQRTGPRPTEEQGPAHDAPAAVPAADSSGILW